MDFAQPHMSLLAEDDEWMEMSRNDDALVAEMLLRLRHAVPPPRPSPALRLVWTVRQRRSGSRKDDDEEKKKNKNKRVTMKKKKNMKKELEKKGVESTRASPSTPLSFSAATSTSCAGAVEGPEESSRPPRSKVSNLKVSETRTTKTSKTVKRKKTVAELKEEENQLMKERRNLKNDLANLRLRVEKERVKNEIFKRKKLDLQLQQQLRTAKSDEVESDAQNEEIKAVFELPDLNLPFEQQYAAEAALYGTS